MNKIKISTDDIIETTIDYVAKYGLENTTTKKVADIMQISEGTIFNRFKSKKELLSECLYYIDRNIDAEIGNSKISIFDISGSIKKLWYKYFNYLLAHPSYSKFYRQFRQSSFYTDDVIKGQDKSFSKFVQLIQKNLDLIGFNTDILWVYVIETTLNFAIRVADGDIANTPKNIALIYKFLSKGFMGNLHLG